MSNKLKSFSLILIALGAIGLIYGFINSPSSVEEVQEMLHADHGSHGEGLVAMESNASTEDAHGDEHAEHLFHQLQNRPWAALYVPAIFIFLISLGAFVFYALQNAAQSGWSPVLFRVMEGIASYLVPGGIIVYIILILSSLHLNHMFVWMDSDVVAHDEIIRNKTGYLNVPFFLIRAAIYIIDSVTIKKTKKPADNLKLRLWSLKSKPSSNFREVLIINFEKTIQPMM
jgi:hypothetical protein